MLQTQRRGPSRFEPSKGRFISSSMGRFSCVVAAKINKSTLTSQRPSNRPLFGSFCQRESVGLQLVFPAVLTSFNEVDSSIKSQPCEVLEISNEHFHTGGIRSVVDDNSFATHVERIPDKTNERTLTPRFQSPAVHDDSDENLGALDPYADLEDSYVKNYAVDRLLTELKEIFHNTLLTQVEQKRDRLLNHKDPDFISRRDKLRDEYNAKLNTIQAYRTLRNDQLDRVFKAEKSVIDQQYEKEKKEAVERIRESLLDKKQALSKDVIESKREILGYLSKGTESMKQILEEDAERLRNVVDAETKKLGKTQNLMTVGGLNPAEIEDDLAVLASVYGVSREMNGDADCVMEDLDSVLECGLMKLSLGERKRSCDEDDYLTIGEPRKHIDIDNLPKICLDITQMFTTASDALAVGETISVHNFSLYEAMSAIEIMDPKMDVGMVKLPVQLGLDDALATGRVNVETMPKDEMIATMDCTIAALATWLNGQSLDQTVFTNILLEDVTLINHSGLKAFCKGILEVVQQFKDLITTAATFKDEDFLVHFYADIMSDTSGVVSELRREIENYNVLIETERRDSGGQVRNTPDRCIRDRLEFIYEILNVTRHFVGFEQTEEGSTSYSLGDFRPNFEEAIHACKKCGTAIMLISRTFKEFGAMPPRDETEASEEDDFLYEWLPAFEPEVNRRLLPAAFPRKRDLMSRVEAFTYFEQLFLKLETIPRDLPNKVPDLDKLLEDMRYFSDNSCVLSRSFLQIVLIPTEQKVFGNFDMKDVILESIRAGIDLKYLQDPAAEAYGLESALENFITDASKCFISIFQMYGYNIARQREVLHDCLEDLGILVTEAADVDNKILKYLVETTNPASLIGLTMPSLYGYVLHHAFSLIYYHFALGFQLQLFEVYEYPYVFWYVQRIICQWYTVLDHRGRQLFESNAKINEALTTPIIEKRKKGKNKSQPQPRKPSEFEQRESILRTTHLNFCHSAIEKGRLLGLLCEAMLKFSLGLECSGQYSIPSNEQDRFESRVQCFRPVCEIFNITYECFKEEAGQNLKHQCEKLFTDASKLLQQFVQYSEKTDLLKKLSYMCKNNMVVANILKMRNTQKVEFAFTDIDFAVIPTLSIPSARS